MARHRSPSGRRAYLLPRLPARKPAAGAGGAHRSAPVPFALRHGAVTATVTGGALALAGPVAAYQAVADSTPVQKVGSATPVDAKDVGSLIPKKAQEALEFVDQLPEQIDASSLIKAADLVQKQQSGVLAPVVDALGTVLPTGCRPNSAGFGAVKPWVAKAGQELRCRFDVNAVGGLAGRAGTSDHPLGLALDFMVDRANGDAMADFLLKNMDRLKIKYIIWKQRINYGNGWQAMEDRGGVTANHFDHVHASFKSG